MGPTGLVAVLFTDMVGSTEVVARLGEERAEQLRQSHFAVLREAVREHAGTEVKNLGDGLMVAFGAASDAVACAVAMQQAVERRNRRAGEALAMRVGVAVGEAAREDSDYFGTPVIEAARLCARAEGGRILVTEMARALAGSRGGHHFESLGPMELKGLPEAVSVHQVRWEALADAAPPLPARLAVDRSLAFIGRAGEREVLERAWKQAEQGARQVVLVAGEPYRQDAFYELLLPSRAAMTTGQTFWVGPVTHDLGLLATVLERYDKAEEHFADAVEVQDRIGAKGTMVHTRLAWARMLLRRAGTNDASKARTLLEEAEAGAREVGIPAIEARIDDLLAQLPTAGANDPASTG